MSPREREVRRLTEVPSLVLDVQATASSPARGALVEIGWAPGAVTGELTPAGVEAHVVAPPPGAVMPRAVARLTGLGPDDWARGVPPAVAWHSLAVAATAVGPAPLPLVVHFSRFEEPFLRDLHARHGTGPFPFDPVCTHAIARRLLPDLPRRTLRALAGYFGAAVPPLRRSADHVVATALVWRHLAGALEDEGVRGYADLREWLRRPPRRSVRRYPLPRERRLALPRGPGVYRLLRSGGGVVYVGKAASLRQRVSGHFHVPDSERALEMLTQVRDVSCTETATPLEAALLESDEIKRLAPPYNRALVAVGRSIWFATEDLRDLREGPDERHTVGPLASPAPFEALAALRAALADAAPAPLARRARALGLDPDHAPGPEPFALGLVRFAREHGRLTTAREVRSVGARSWAERLAKGAADAVDDEPETAPPPPRFPAWDEGRVFAALEVTTLRAAHAVRRARWLLWLSECTLAWRESPACGNRRLLSIERGAVAACADLPPGVAAPPPARASRPAADRRGAFDVSTFDRLRVLTTELRPLADHSALDELRLGLHARLSPRRLATVLRWV